MEKKESFVFYASFADALAELDDEQRLQLYDAIVWYALEGRQPEQLTGVGKIIWHLIEPQIRANYERWKKGFKGGRPSNNTEEKPVVKEEPVQTSDFNIGDKVKLIAGATYYNGKSIPSWVFKKTLYVRKISGEKITVSYLKTGAVTGTVDKDDLIKC